MSTHNTREEIELKLWKAFKERKPFVYEEALEELKQAHHQELQKARHDWLREEIVKLEGMKYKTSYCGYAFRSTTVDTKSAVDCINGAEKMGRNKAIQTIIDRYQAELNQLNK